MDEETYKALLEQIEQQNAKIEQLEKTVQDVRNLNRALIGRTVDPKAVDKASELEKLGDKLNRGLNHGKSSQ
jgi:predicted RNase H-like nuclease (RuvC/YqgF family)